MTLFHKHHFVSHIQNFEEESFRVCFIDHRLYSSESH